LPGANRPVLHRRRWSESLQRLSASDQSSWGDSPQLVFFVPAAGMPREKSDSKKHFFLGLKQPLSA
jgi:hypothetical protein